MEKSTALPVCSLFIHPADLQALRSDSESDDPVPARLKLGGRAYQTDISYRGAYTRRFKKKSYCLTFRSPNICQGAREWHLNAEYADPSMIRNKLSFDFFHQLGHLAPDSRYIQLKLNGVNQGVYLQLESVDDLFLKKRSLPPGILYYAVDNDANFSLLSPIDEDVKAALEDGYKLKTGEKGDFRHLRELVYTINTTPQADFAKVIATRLEIEPYFNWLAGVVCTQNFDAFIQNYALYRNGETGKFLLIPWDFDGTWGRNLRGKRLRHDFVPITGYNTLTARLLAVPAYRSMYRERMTRILETDFTPETLEPTVQKLLQTIRPAIAADPYLQGRLERFDAEYDVILAYIRNRNAFLREQLPTLS
ncbi:spore coat protein H [Tumebacillus sp. BK434]|uniref:CotH kinase family protein n=1 Tax=Tumebacillus sp. BK434 TaxID=2512169 RepID=UPI001047E4E8|nr:CotH kinase family protein [Tumebacillus sp. BK434]TCP59178.1 spore coat protein H [Tumebacillus sp. BK434]